MTTTLTNDQITAGAAVLCDHGQPIGRNAAIEVSDAMQAAQPNSSDFEGIKTDYNDPHVVCSSCGLTMGESRTLAHLQLGKLVATPSPQIAEKVELPSIDSAEFRQKLRTYHDEASYGSLRVADNNIIAYIDGKVRDAIAASRRSPSPQVADIADVAKFKQAFHEASRVGAGYDEAVAVGLAASRRAAATVLAELIEAADATVERWHSRDWKQPHTAEFINRLALAIGTVRGLRAPSPNNSPV